MNASTERWLPVPGYAGLYSVSDQGRIRAEPKTVRHSDRICQRKPRIMKPAQSVKSKYLTVRLLSAEGTYTTHYVHTLVLEAFVGQRPQAMDACHCDGDRQNNSLSNLRWDTRAGNHADKHAHGTATIGERHPMRKLDDATVLAMRARVAAGAAPSSLGAEFNVSRMAAYRAATGRSWRHLT